MEYMTVKRFWNGKFINVPVDKALYCHYLYMKQYRYEHGTVQNAKSFKQWLISAEQ